MTPTDPTTAPPERTPPDVFGICDEKGEWTSLHFMKREDAEKARLSRERVIRLVPAGSEVAAVLGALNERHAELQKLRLDAVEELNWHTASAYRQNEDRMKAAIDAINEILPTLNQLDAKAEARDA